MFVSILRGKSRFSLQMRNKLSYNIDEKRYVTLVTITKVSLKSNIVTYFLQEFFNLIGKYNLFMNSDCLHVATSMFRNKSEKDLFPW